MARLRERPPELRGGPVKRRRSARRRPASPIRAVRSVHEATGRPGALLILWDVTANRAGLDASLVLATIVEQVDDAIDAVDQESASGVPTCAWCS